MNFDPTHKVMTVVNLVQKEKCVISDVTYSVITNRGFVASFDYLRIL